MKIRKQVSKPFRHEDEDVSVAGAVNAVVSANVNEPGAGHTRVSSRQRIVQRNGRTEVFEEHHSVDGDSDPKATEESSND